MFAFKSLRSTFDSVGLTRISRRGRFAAVVLLLSSLFVVSPIVPVDLRSDVPILSQVLPQLEPVSATATCAQGGVCVVGDTGPGGGKVFYVATDTFTQIGATGTMCTNNCKYLEAAPTDWLTGTPGDPGRTWANGAWDGTGNNDNRSVTTSNAIGSGYQNSLNIVAQTGNTADNSAGVLARDYRGGTKNDWYLPSKVELNQMCKWARGQAWVSDLSECERAAGVNDAASGFCCFWYWSSTQKTGENGAAAAYWMIGSLDPRLSEGLSKANAGRVRPVRAFAQAPPPADLVITIDTTLGIEAKTVFLPITGITGGGITVDWGDGTPPETVTSDHRPHTYAAHGLKTISVSGGAFNNFYSPQCHSPTTANCTIFTGVTRWGNYSPTSFHQAFLNWSNLTSVPASIPASVTPLERRTMLTREMRWSGIM